MKKITSMVIVLLGLTLLLIQPISANENSPDAFYSMNDELLKLLELNSKFLELESEDLELDSKALELKSLINELFENLEQTKLDLIATEQKTLDLIGIARSHLRERMNDDSSKPDDTDEALLKEIDKLIEENTQKIQEYEASITVFNEKIEILKNEISALGERRKDAGDKILQFKKQLEAFNLRNKSLFIGFN
ncbi:hypothetical protein [Glaciecola sp. 1036]|uniref:hypothetical protein n=1 Tax=Alteromonadaceae TaxID=72275 RepID=UPI003CFC0839